MENFLEVPQRPAHFLGSGLWPLLVCYLPGLGKLVFLDFINMFCYSYEDVYGCVYSALDYREGKIRKGYVL